MLLVSLRDLQYRRRRFAVGIAGTSLVLALTLILAGVSASFANEARRTTEAFGAASWVVPAGVTGPFMSSATLPATLADELAAATGSPAAAVAILRATVPVSGEDAEVNLLGVPPGSFADPPVDEGRAPRAAGEAAVDDLLDADIGDVLTINGQSVAVVGRTHGLSFRAGVPNIYVPLADAQALGYRGAQLATTIATQRALPVLGAGYTVLTDDDVVDDLLEPLASPRQTISMILGLLWLVAAMIVGSIVYLSSLDRVRDFAVFKAMGATDRALFGGIMAQALLISLAAYVVGVGLSQLLKPLLPMPAEIAGSAYALLAVVAVVVALVSSLAGVRRAVSVDPALAFGGA